MKNEIDLQQIEESRDSYPNKFLNLFYKAQNSSAFIYDMNINRCIYMSAFINAITGYLSTDYTNKGILFFKALIHPSDYSTLICDIVTFLQTENNYSNGKNGTPIKSILCKMKHKKESWVQTRINVIKIETSRGRKSERIIGYIEKTNLPNEKNDFISTPQISAREKDVLKLIASGDSAKIIGIKLNIGENTVISHRKNLKNKLKAKNTAELIKKAVKAKLV